MVKKFTYPIRIRKWSFEMNYKKNLEKSIHLKTSGTMMVCGKKKFTKKFYKIG
jgi:hypothetical protein